MEALTGMWSLKLRVNEERVIDVVDVELFQKEFLAISNWKTCKYQHAGFSTRGGCEIYSVVDRVCLKLKIDDTNGEWSVDSEGGSGVSLGLERRRAVTPSTGSRCCIIEF